MTDGESCWDVLGALPPGGLANLADLLPILGLPAQAAFTPFVERRVGEAAHQILLLTEGRARQILTPSEESAWAANLDDRIFSVLTLVAVAGTSPGECLDALRKARTGDRFLASVAMELVGEHLPAGLRDLVAPLLAAKPAPDQLQERSERAGFPPVGGLTTEALKASGPGREMGT